MQRPHSAPVGETPAPVQHSIEERQQLAVLACARILEQAAGLRQVLSAPVSGQATAAITRQLLDLVETTKALRGHVDCVVKAAEKGDYRDKGCEH